MADGWMSFLEDVLLALMMITIIWYPGSVVRLGNIEILNFIWPSSIHLSHTQEAEASEKCLSSYAVNVPRELVPNSVCDSTRICQIERILFSSISISLRAHRSRQLSQSYGWLLVIDRVGYFSQLHRSIDWNLACLGGICSDKLWKLMRCLKIKTSGRK